MQHIPGSIRWSHFLGSKKVYSGLHSLHRLAPPRYKTGQRRINGIFHRPSFVMGNSFRSVRDNHSCCSVHNGVGGRISVDQKLDQIMKASSITDSSGCSRRCFGATLCRLQERWLSLIPEKQQGIWCLLLILEKLIQRQPCIKLVDPVTGGMCINEPHAPGIMITWKFPPRWQSLRISQCAPTNLRNYFRFIRVPKVVPCVKGVLNKNINQSILKAHAVRQSSTWHSILQVKGEHYDAPSFDGLITH